MIFDKIQQVLFGNYFPSIRDPFEMNFFNKPYYIDFMGKSDFAQNFIL
jgi:hypothetical protein